MDIWHFYASLICKKPPLLFLVNSAKYPVQPIGKGVGGQLVLEGEKKRQSNSELLVGEMH